MIVAISFKFLKEEGFNVARFDSNFTDSIARSKVSCSFFSICGHPILLAGPGVSIHLSSLSGTPSPSVSGQPFVADGPYSFLHSSLPSGTPSPSLSIIGQPLFSLLPGTLGHSSELSGTPSPSVSGQPPKIFGPASSG